MNWDAIGAVGELLGAALLIGSLIYVAFQVRDAKTQIKSATSQARVDSYQNLVAVRLQPELANAELTSRKAPEKLTDLDRFYMFAFLSMFMSHWQNVYYQRRIGTLVDEQSGALDTLPLFKLSPYYITIWKKGEWKGSFDTDFIQHVDSIIGEILA